MILLVDELDKTKKSKMIITEKKVLRFSLGLTALVILVLLMIFVAPIPLKDFQEEFGFNRVTTIDFDESDLYYNINGNLWNTDRPDYVLPNDFLRYTSVFQTKKDYPIELHVEVKIYVGEKNVTDTTILPAAKFTSDEHTTGVSLLYHAKELGRNVLLADYKFVNSSNNAVLEEFTKITKYDVVSLDFMSQDISNKNTHTAFISSIVVGIGTLIALISYTIYSRSNVNEMKKQNEEFKEQHNIENRPWVGPLAGLQRHSTFDNKFVFNFKNAGKTPAHVEESIGYSHNSLDRKEIRSNRGHKVKSIMIPNQEANLSLAIQELCFNEIINGRQDLYIMVYIKYDFLDSNDEYGVLYKWNKTRDSFDVIDEWIK
jgi:hypothetical protein